MNPARIAAVLVGSAGVVVGAIQASKPDLLGITPQISAWMGIVGALISFWQMLLPSVRQPSA